MFRILAGLLAAALVAVAALPTTAAAETADEFVARLDRQFKDLALEWNAAGWTQATYINVDTQLLNARATERWLAAFDAALPAIRALGFDERFIRCWRFYLAYCAAGFDTETTDVAQYTFIRD